MAGRDREDESMQQITTNIACLTQVISVLKQQLTRWEEVLATFQNSSQGSFEKNKYLGLLFTPSASWAGETDSELKRCKLNDALDRFVNESSCQNQRVVQRRAMLQIH